MTERRHTSRPTARLIALGAALTLLSCLCAAYALVCLLFFEPTGDPPFSEAELGVTKTLAFNEARARRLGVCIQATPGDRYAIELTDSVGHSVALGCAARAECGFEETCEVGAMATGSRVVVRGKAPARIVLHEAREAAGGHVFGALSASALLFAVALGSFVFAGKGPDRQPEPDTLGRSGREAR